MAEEIKASFEELGAWEYEFEDARLELLRQQDAVLAPLYTKRQPIIDKIPDFWSIVFEQCPPEFDTFILPSDSQLFADCLIGLEVKRFDVNNPKGSPRSVSIKLKFSENKYFSNTELEKKFWFRRTKDGWSGLVSEPVKIDWKKGQDLTNGFTDAVYKLWEARQKLGGWASGKEALAKGAKAEFDALEKKIEGSDEESLSFFVWFSFLGAYRYVSAEESAAAEVEEVERRRKVTAGEKIEMDDEDEDDEAEEYIETEIFPGGEDLAQLMADDLWPDAFDYFTAAHEQDEFGSDLMESEEDEDEDEEMADLQALAGKGKKEKDGPPVKKRKA